MGQKGITMKKLAICIPNYNRIKELERLLRESIRIISENSLNNYIQICISDDCSKENPDELIHKLKIENPEVEIVYCRNDKNMGMDYNFLNSVLISQSDYCWIVGNDDMPVERGVIQLIEKIKNSDEIDIIVTPFNSYDKDDKKLSTIYPLGNLVETEKLFCTYNDGEYNDLIQAISHNSGIFGFLSNIVFKKERWEQHKGMFVDRMDSIFIQMYMNIQSLQEGAYYLYWPEKIIKNYADDITNGTIERKYRILVGLDRVLNDFFGGERKEKLQKVVVDEFINGFLWNLPDDSEYKQKVVGIESQKNYMYRKYFIKYDNIADYFNNRMCVIYGAGNYGRRALGYLEDNNVNVIGFCDLDINKQGTYIDKYEIFDYSKLLSIYAQESCCIVVANNHSLVEIISKLISDNVTDIAIIT